MPLSSLTYLYLSFPYSRKRSIEYANTSLSKDLDAKRKISATAEIQEYWVVDLKHRQLKVFREPGEGDYSLEETLTVGEISPIAFPDITISVQLLFDGL